MTFSDLYLSEASEIAKCLDREQIEKIVELMATVRNRKGRVYFMGVGGSSANASHATNDFRKLCEIESYCITDNIAELTARTNDDGWETTFAGILKVNNLREQDCVFVLSVGGGSLERKISTNICLAIDYAKSKGSYIVGIVGKAEGYLQANSNYVIRVPIISEDRVTPHSESFQLEILHLMVTHPRLNVNKTTW